ncbi:MAG TPA: bifunctional phosphoribosylaminoimidazolecarboxamide formyltransferase/IMP cyclohydrolase [Longimicrobiales bacterium]|nr:bifunctional phosphoribosylaminoimidazolecarboxamide formyltransferase/IMP cyclohydrolase [Longimicrobiales bacterium]
MPRAILSVSDKSGLVDFARGLSALGWDLISTGGTARALREADIPVRDVSDVTGHPEMMDGRVKTLHPAIHAGILARREVEEDAVALERLGYDTIDLVVVNLYPFRQTVARGVPFDEAVEQIDIGGPTMIRSAAKNHADVLVVVDPADYGRILDALRDDAVDDALKRELALKVFRHTADYDAAIAAYLAGQGAGAAAHAAGDAAAGTSSGLPDRLDLSLAKVQDLRYGENPDQAAAFYAENGAPAGSTAALKQLHGKELSFNNLIDIDGAVMAVTPWADGSRIACAVMKHTTPCGLALGADATEAYRRALATDPVSAYGGIVALNVPCTAEAAEAMASHFLEVIVAPSFEDGALEVLTKKKNLRLIELPITVPGEAELDYKRVRGGLLAQQRLRMRFPEDEWRVASERQPTDDEWRDLRFAWRACAVVKSNAIVLARGEQLIGVGAGQMSRVDSSRIAVMKAADQEFDTAGAVVASDAYFPFRDGVDAAAAAGASAIIQPGGSIRDEETIAAANEHGMAMVFTGRRVFRH